MKNNLFIAFIFISLSIELCSCKQRPETLFVLLSPEKTGVSFSNKIDETDSFNILTHEYIYNGGGVGVGDFNNDGLQDLFFCGNMVSNSLYLNTGGLKFKDVSEVAKISGNGKWNSGVSVVDINNDGLLDIYVTATMKPDSASRRNMLFINKGLNSAGVPEFEDRAAQYKINYGGYSVTSAFFDYDRDGDLDLYILTNVKINNKPTTYREKIIDGSAPNNDKLYRNNGNGTFTDVTVQAGIKEEGFGLGLAISDFNRDGWPDIYVSNDYLANDILYINNRNGTFSNETQKFIGHQSQFSMGNDAADFNNDLLPDIITLDMLPENNLRKKTTISNKSYQTYIYNEKFNYQYQYVRNMLQLNDGMNEGKKFSEIGQMAGVYQTEWSWSPLFADFDNDGWKDLLITNGFPRDITDKDFANYRVKVGNLISNEMLLDSIPIVKIPHYAFKNNSNLTFADVSNDWGVNISSFSNAAAFADLDNDGDLDYIVCNINEVAFLFENQLGKNDKTPPSFLSIKLNGSENNRNGIGASVTISQQGNLQFSENNVYRGFLSSVENHVHFGLGNNSKVDSILVEWPDGRTQIIKNPSTNQNLIFNYTESNSKEIKWLPKISTGPLFEKGNRKASIHFKHREEDIIDFNNQRTIPHKFSQNGPGIAVGDVDNNGTDDIVVGASAGHPTVIFKQKQDGTFTSPSLIDRSDKPQEDTGLLLFDADMDGDLDLFIASGGSPYNSDRQCYQHRFYSNDGKGGFKFNQSVLPQIFSVASCVRAADYDADGDLDLFIGGRISQKGYPLAGESFILKDNHGVFENITDLLSKELNHIGMVTDALWSDFDNDGRIDLIVVGEFMPMTFFKNTSSGFIKLDKTGIENSVGLWNSLVGGDFDSDGDTDYVAGNLGENSCYQASEQYPLTLFAKDFDNNGSIDPILSCYSKTSMRDDTKQLFPVHFWEELNSQSPLFRRKFNRFQEYGSTTLEQLFTESELNGVLKLKANHLKTSYIENKGKGQFAIRPLPRLIQIAPINGMTVGDYNKDGNLDIALIGNSFANEVFTGRYDAFNGTLLLGDGKGNLNLTEISKKSFYVPGDAKALAVLTINGTEALIATQNRDSLLCFVSNVSSKEKYFEPGSLDQFGEFELNDGKKQRVEFYYGSGYLSQSARRLKLPENVNQLKVIDSRGKPRTIPISK